MRVWPALLALTLSACLTPVGMTEVAELAGPWRGRIAGPRGNAAAQMTVDEAGRYTGTMFLDAGDRPFHGQLTVVRPGEVRYQGTDGSGAARLYRQDGRATLRFRGDDGVLDGVFTR